jgi:hypothetical protein
MTEPTDPSFFNPVVPEPGQSDQDEAADDALLHQLRLAVAAADPLPSRLVETAKAAYVWRTVDEDLAQLQFDSLTGSEVLVRSDGAHGVHLSFASSVASVEVEVAGQTIVGQVVPAGAASVSLLLSTGQRIDTVCDDHGQFRFDQKPSGPVRLVAHLASGDIVTEWFTA